jgi:hypothetical protein
VAKAEKTNKTGGAETVDLLTALASLMPKPIPEAAAGILINVPAVLAAAGLTDVALDDPRVRAVLLAAIMEGKPIGVAGGGAEAKGVHGGEDAKGQ